MRSANPWADDCTNLMGREHHIHPKSIAIREYSEKSIEKYIARPLLAKLHF